LKQEIERKLIKLIEKWKDKIPATGSKHYWSYRCDKCLAIRLKYQLEQIKLGKVPEEHWEYIPSLF
jgi:hypothetical protein